MSSRWTKGALGLAVFTAVGSVPLLIAPADEAVEPAAVLAVDPEIDQVIRFLEWRAPDTMDPVLRRQVATAIVEEGRMAGLEPLYILAVIGVESEFSPQAVSNRNAKGLMQLRDVTFSEMRRLEGIPEEVSEPEDVVNVRVGVRYLAHLQGQFGTQLRALAAWNAGPGAVRREIEENGEIPDRWLAYGRRVQREHRILLRQIGPDRPDSLAVRPASPPSAAAD